MKKALKFLGNFALAAVIGFSMVSCPVPTDGDPQFVNYGEVQVVTMNISEVEFDGVKSEWDWIAAIDNETKSSILFNVDETGRIPTRVFYKPDKELDVSFSFECRENGLPEMMEFNGYILYFDNFEGYTFDLAIVAPDETVEYHFGIEYDVDFDSWDARIMASVAGRSVFSSGRSVVDAFTGGFSGDPVSTAIDVVGYLVDLGICVASIFLPPLLVGCIVGAISQVVDIGLSVLTYFVNDADFVGEMGEWTINGVNLMIDALGCMKMIVGKKWADYKGWLDCGAAFVTLADVVVGTVKNLFDYFSSSGTKDAVKDEMTPVMGKAKVTFSVNNGKGTAPAAQTVDTANGYGAVTLPSVAGLSRDGYSTSGWDTSPKATGYYQAGVSQVVKEGNTTFYAVWIPDVPNAPTGVTAVPISSSSIKLSWTAFSGAGYYIVYRSTSANGNYERVGTASVTSYTDKGLSLDTAYYYKVSAWSPGAKGESEKSAYTYATILPDVPIRVTATTVSSSNIRVNWAAFSGAGYDGVGYYIVYRSTSASGNYERAGSTADGTITSYMDSGLSANTVYYYKVSAWSPGAKGESGKSAAAYARTLTGSSGGVTAPAITTSSLPNGAVGTAYSQTLTATGSTPITWSIESGALPAGLSLSGAGTISGTPTTAGTSNFTVRAANAAGSATKALAIVIDQGGSGAALTITTASLPNGMKGKAYSQTLTATGDTPITWSIESGALPAGLTLTAGVIAGTPETVGTSNFTVKAANAGGSVTKALSITITPSGGSMNEAIPLTFNQWADGNLSTSSDEQWFTFTAASTQWIHAAFGTLPSSGGVYVYVYTSSGTASGSESRLYSENRYNTSTTKTSRSLTAGQTYYIRVRPYSGYSGTYRIGFTGAIAPPGGAIPLTENQWADGSLPTSDDVQWFTFTATASKQYIHFERGTLTRLYANVYDSSGAQVGNGPQGVDPYIYRTLTPGQTYYIQANPDINYIGDTYRIAFNTAIVAPDTTIIPLTFNQWADGNLPTSRDVQWFTFTATAASTQIYLERGTLTVLYVRVYDSSGEYVGDESELSNNTFRSLIPGQTYYIRALPRYNNIGTYRIGFNASILPPGFNPIPLTENQWANGSLPMPTSYYEQRWFTFTATASTQYIHAQLGTLISTFYTPFTVYVYDSLVPASGNIGRINLDVATKWDGSVSLSLTPGQTYYINAAPSDTSYAGTYRIGFNTSSTAPTHWSEEWGNEE
jgi:fibronectin type 3 domain-containing protein